MPTDAELPSAQDTLLVTQVVGRMERALARLWHVPAGGLRESINTLGRQGVANHLLRAMHYLRMERNRVLHHPQRPLRDSGRYRALGEQVLAFLERDPSAALTPPTQGATSVSPPLKAPTKPPGGEAFAGPALDLAAHLRALNEARLRRLLAVSRPSGATVTSLIATQMVHHALERLRAIQARAAAQWAITL